MASGFLSLSGMYCLAWKEGSCGVKCIIGIICLPRSYVVLMGFEAWDSFPRSLVMTRGNSVGMCCDPLTESRGKRYSGLMGKFVYKDVGSGQ